MPTPATTGDPPRRSQAQNAKQTAISRTAAAANRNRLAITGRASRRGTLGFRSRAVRRSASIRTSAIAGIGAIAAATVALSVASCGSATPTSSSAGAVIHEPRRGTLWDSGRRRSLSTCLPRGRRRRCAGAFRDSSHGTVCNGDQLRLPRTPRPRRPVQRPHRRSLNDNP